MIVKQRVKQTHTVLAVIPGHKCHLCYCDVLAARHVSHFRHPDMVVVSNDVCCSTSITYQEDLLLCPCVL